jgi:2-polyprenyl-3-methyl-5-hydroxy-6-metoxy-1,4-benzoquinol methylase
MRLNISSKRYFEDSSVDFSTINPRSYAVRKSGTGKKILEIGTSSGGVTKFLKEFGNEIVGIEIDEEAAKEAEKYCSRMIIGNVEEINFIEAFRDEKFDVIIITDILEHLIWPEFVLKEFHYVLKESGYLIVSIPNFCHADIFLNLMRGDFHYTSTGLLDCSHLRFFCLKNIYDLFKACKYEIRDLNRVILEKSELHIIDESIPEELYSFVKFIPDSFVYQYVFLAYPNQAPTNLSLPNYSLCKISQLINQQFSSQYLDEMNQINSELIDIKQSIFWQLLVKYDKIIDKIFPHNTLQRHYYDLAITGIKISKNEGFRLLIKKSAHYLCKKGISKSINNFESIDTSNHKEPITGSIPDIICFPIINWDFRYQRPQHLLSRFGNAGHRVFYIPTSLSPMKKPFSIRDLQKNVFEVNISLIRSLNIYLDELTIGQINSFCHSFEKLKPEFNIENAIIFVQFPKWEPIVSALNALYGYKIVYDCLDEYSDFPNIHSSILDCEVSLVKGSDLVIATSKYLYNKVCKHQKNVFLLPNAGEFEHFHNLSSNCKLNYIQKPIIGYFGAIAEWFDIELIIHIARDRPDWNLVLIGNTDGCSIKKAEKLPNVYFLGEKKYVDLPDFLYWFDVCLIPFKLTELIKATHPVKFYEYLSTGKPVVSAKLPELLQYNHLCYFYENKDEAIKVISQALNENDEKLREKRIQFAQENTWDNRVETYLTHIHELYQIEGN